MKLNQYILYIHNILDQFELKLIQMRYIQIWYIQFRIKIWWFRVNRTRGDDCTFFSGCNYHSYQWPQTTGPFFSGCNYVKIGFGGNVTTGKKCTVVWLAMFFSGFKLQPEKNTTGKKTYSRPAVSWKLEKITSRKKGTVISSHRLEGKTQNTTLIIDTTTNKMSCATLPSSGFAPSLSMGGAVAPPNHGAATPQSHAQPATHRGCACCRCFCLFWEVK